MRNRVDFGIAALIAIFALLSLPLLFTFKKSVYSVDEYKWHVPAIKQIYDHWPALDVRNDSLSAIAPGYLRAFNRSRGSDRKPGPEPGNGARGGREPGTGALVPGSRHGYLSPRSTVCETPSPRLM